MPTAGKLGKLAPKKVDGLRFIEEYLLKDRLPKAGREVDNSAGITDWGMLGNDTHGDCGPVGYLHVHMADAANFRLKESWPTADQVVREYLAYTGGQDEGVVLADFLSFCQQHSFCGKSLIGYAPAHHDNLAEVRSVIKLFNAAYVGVQLPQIGLDQFERDEEWDLTDTRADDKIAGGHCVVPVEFVPGRWGFVTWGKIQFATTRWVERYIDEAWAPLTDDFATANPNLFDYPALLHDLAVLRG
jgi:hypothetical protein